MVFLTKRKTTFFAIGFQFITSGIEYAVIFPSLNLYLQREFPGLADVWLGVIISAFAAAGLVTGPVIGRLADLTQRTRWILVVLNLFTIIGSFMYCFPLSPLFLTLGRFIAGIGGAAGGALIVNLTWATTESERTSLLSLFMGVRQLGLLVGPACNLFLIHFDFHIGPVHIDKYSSPGLFLGILSSIGQVIFTFGYFDLAKAGEEGSDTEPVFSVQGHERAEDGIRGRLSSISEEVVVQGPSSGLIDRSRQRWRYLLTGS